MNLACSKIPEDAFLRDVAHLLANSVLLELNMAEIFKISCYILLIRIGKDNT